MMVNIVVTYNLVDFIVLICKDVTPTFFFQHKKYTIISSDYRYQFCAKFNCQNVLVPDAAKTL